MLKHRLLTAAIALPGVMAAIYYAPAGYFFALLALFVVMSLYECLSILLPALTAQLAPEEIDIKFWRVMFLVAGFLCFVPFFVASLRDAVLIAVAVIILVLGVVTLMASSPVAIVTLATAFVFGVGYAVMPWISMWYLFLLRPHGAMVFLVLAVVMLTDTGGYFVGKQWGKSKLAPKLSPKKSWEGFIGGVLAAGLGVVVINQLLDLGFRSYAYLFVFSIVGSSFALVGDLFESALKRFAGVKDSGNIFPGHGGFLDRADSVIFAAPILLGVLIFLAQ